MTVLKSHQVFFAVFFGFGISHPIDFDVCTRAGVSNHSLKQQFIEAYLRDGFYSESTEAAKEELYRQGASRMDVIAGRSGIIPPRISY